MLPTSTNVSLSFNGNGSIADYEQVVRALQYRFTGEEFDFIFPLRFVQLQIADTIQSSFSIVQITLLPINDQMPVFDLSEYTIDVPENATIGSSILRLIATDGDRFSTNSIQYSITAGNEGSFFSISQNTGDVLLQRMLDYETARTHRFIVQVLDANFEGAVTTAPSSATVSVNVLDINDRVPMLDSTDYNATIGESVSINTFVLQVFASDDDSAAHSALEFSLVNTTDFAINQDGTIFTNANLDRERVEVYYFVVRVRNPGLAAFDMATVTVTVLDFDDNAPMLTLNPNTVILMEPNTIVQLSVNLDITDLDPNPSLDYAIVQVIGLSAIGQLFSTVESGSLAVSGNGTTMIVITGESRPISDYISILRGVVYQDLADEPTNADRVIAYQVGSNIDFNQPIQLEDSPGETTSNISLFTVTVRLINDQLPTLSLDQRLQTNLPSPCLGSPGSYFTTYMENQLNRVSLSHSSLAISDSDSGENMIQFAEVQIQNAADRGLERLSVSLQENSSVSVMNGSDDFKIVLTGSATSQDYEAALRSVVYSHDGEAFPTTNDERVVSFIVNDGAFNSTTVFACILLVDSNDAPMIFTGTNGTVDTMVMYREGQQDPLPLAPELQIRDVDGNAFSLAFILFSPPLQFSFESVSVSNPSNVVEVRISSDQINIGSSSDIIPTMELESILRSIVYDTNRTTDMSEVMPRQVTFVVVDEIGLNSEPANVILNFNLIDNPPILDLNGAGVPGNDYNIDYREGAGPIQLVSDGIMIEDIDSSIATSLQVVVPQLQDGDEYYFPDVASLNKSMFSNLTYLAVTYSGSMPRSAFRQLLVESTYRNTLDEPMPATKYVLFQVFTLAAGDTGTSAPSNVATTTITLLPVNDNRPVFSQVLYRGSVDENAPVGIAIGVTVQATDADIYGSTNINFVSSDARFYVHPVSGTVLTTVLFDAEDGTSINFTITASDNDNTEMFASVPVIVTINDINDNPPVFQRRAYSLNISETFVVGMTVLTVSAADGDVSEQFSNITYHLFPFAEETQSSGNGPLSPADPSVIPFAVNPTTGAITLTTPLDFDEGQKTYNFLVVASDSAIMPLTASAQVTVNIQDVNDNPPSFTNAPFSFVVQENVFPYVVVQLMAQDMDSGINGEVRFSLEGTTIFSVDSVSGIVSLTEPLDHEVTDRYSFTAAVRDLGSPSLISSVNFNVEVTNLNDNSPLFIRPPGPSVVYDVPENTVFAETIEASDRDGDSVFYSIIGGPDFQINLLTGMISSTSPLDYEFQTTYSFAVEVTDGRFTERLNVTINVLDENDNAPVFLDAPFDFVVQENQFPYNIVQVMAQDGDSGSNSDLRFELEGTTNFSVDSMSGLVSLNGPLDYEATRMYSFAIIARDLGSPSLSIRENFIVRVSNLNDNPPVFVRPPGPSITFSVRENTDFQEIVEVLDADGDSIFYALLGGQGFEINQFTGAVTSTITLDFELQRSHSFTIEATDNTFITRLNVTVNVLDVDDNRPVFRPTVYSAEVPETLTVGSPVIQLQADDMDSNENAILVYSLLDSQIPFMINGETGEITLSSPLDFNAGPTSYRFNASVRNPAPSVSGMDVALVIIAVRDVNNLVPMLTLTQTNVTFIENSEPIFIVPDIIVRDEDSSDHLLAACAVVFTRSCPSTQLAPCSETISINEDLAEQLTLFSQSEEREAEQVIVINGNSSEVAYQSVLRSLQYSNSAPEPVPGLRSVEIQCTDNDFSSNVVTVSVGVRIRNEFCPVITINSSTLNFTESATRINVGELIGLALRDEDSMPHQTLQSLRITLSNRLDSSEEFLAITNASGLRVNSTESDFFPVGSGSGQDIMAQTIRLRSPRQPSSIRMFMRALRSLVYVNNRPEPSLMPRMITITPMDSTNNCMPVSVVINIIPLNDNPPMITLAVNSPQQYLENSIPLAFARRAGLMISDLDHNRLFPLESATIRLQGIRDGADERLRFNSSLVPVGVTPMILTQQDSSMLLQFNGRAQVARYQSLLLSLTYTNFLSEPTPGNRSISITVSDGIHRDMTAVIVIVVLQNDSPLTIRSTDNVLDFTEGDVAIAVGVISALTLIDEDRNAMIENLTVTLVGALEEDREFLVVNAPGSGGLLTGTKIVLTQPNTLESYQNVLSTLQYSYITNTEEIEGTRVVLITASDGIFSSNDSILVDVMVLNNNAPTVVFGGNNRTDFVEGSTVPLRIGAIYQPQVQDDDNNTLFRMQSATVQLLSAVDGSNEYIDVTDQMRTTLTGMGINVTRVSFHSLTISGEGTPLVYQQALASVVYFNGAPEPTRTQLRRVQFEVFDGIFLSNPISGSVSITLVNDNPIVLDCNPGIFNFTEGSRNSILIAQDLSLSDRDVDHTLRSVTITLVNGRQEDAISVNSNGTVGVTVSRSDSRIELVGNTLAMVYQDALRTLSFLNTADEPSAGQREITITAASQDESQSCTIMVSVLPINDNPPVVDLSGQEAASINYTQTLNYNFTHQSSVEIASSVATITDRDNSPLRALEVQLIPGYSNDGIFLREEVGCPLDNTSTCHIRLFPRRSCTCSNTLGRSANPRILTLQRTSHRIRITQPEGGIYSYPRFEFLLRNIRFAHDPVRPPVNEYTAYVQVTASDGQLTSEAAVTRIDISIPNFSPLVFIEGQTDVSVEMRDGQSRIELLSAMQQTTILEDTAVISSVSIILANPMHSSERISISIPNQPPSIEIINTGGSSILLVGPASPMDFTSALTDAVLYYHYPPMESILQGDIPDFTTRVIHLEATDGESASGQISSVHVTFNRTCSVLNLADGTRQTILRIPDGFPDYERLLLCTAIEIPRTEIARNASISSLSFMRNIQSIGDLVIRQLAITDLSGLENLQRINDELLIEDNPYLTTMKQLGLNLPDEYRTSIRNINVKNNSELLDVEGLGCFQNMTGLLAIIDAPNLRNVSGLRNLERVGTLVIAVTGLPSIRSINILYEASFVIVASNRDIESVSGFQGLRRVGTLQISQNPRLISIDGFSGLQQKQAGYVYITNNQNLCYILGRLSNENYWTNIVSRATRITPIPTAESCSVRNCNTTATLPCLNGGTCMDMTTNVSSVTCSCSDVFFGEGCQYSNACSDTPCLNGGICMVDLFTPSQFTCMCPSGFEGGRCEIIVSPCASSPCGNQASCIDSDDGNFECRCAPGYTGQLCDINIDDCSSSPCNNGGTCIDFVNDFMCNCQPGFSGPTCSSRVIFCSSEPCSNGGTCDEGDNSFICSCSPGYTGITCEADINECTNELTNPCQNGSSCINEPGTFSCFCPPGLTGPICENRIDFCLSNPCSSNGTSACMSQATGFQCICNGGYTGTLCEEELNLCDPDPCLNGTCIQIGGSYMCMCPPELTGRRCDIDINDCVSSPCANNGNCTDQFGGFTCECPPGITGTTCSEPINFCTNQTCYNGGNCSSIGGTFSCSCTNGWMGNQCQFPDSVVTKLASCGFPGARDMLAELFIAQNNEALPVRNGAPFFNFMYQLNNANGVYISGWIWQEENTNSVIFSFNDFDTASTATFTSNLPGKELQFSYVSTSRGVDLSSVFADAPLRESTWMHFAIAIFNDSIIVNVDGTFTSAMPLQGTGSLVVPQTIILNIGGGTVFSQASAFSGLLKGIAVNQIMDTSSNFDLQALQTCTVNCVGGASFCSVNGQCRDLFGPDRICRCPFGFTGLRCQNMQERVSFDGSSFAVLNDLPDFTSFLQFSFKTRQAQGHLYSIAQPLVRTSLQLQDARTLHINHTSCNQVTGIQELSSQTDLNTLQYQSLTISDFIQLNDNDRVPVITPDTTSCNETFTPRMFLGGTPDTSSGFQGCMRDISINGNQLDASRLLLSEGAKFGCTHDTAQFNTFSHLELPQFISRQFQQISFEFSTQTSAGLIYFSRRIPDDATGSMPNDFIAIYIQEGQAVFSFNLGEQNQALVLRSGNNINDGQWHKLTAIQNGTMASLYLDDTLMVEQSLGPLMLLDTTGSVFLGGVPSENRIRTFQNYDGFNGCVRDLEQNGNTVDLQSHLTQSRVRFGVCN